MEIYERIRNRRKDLGLTAEDIAARLGVSRATAYRYETEEVRSLPAVALEKLAKVLHTTPAYLMGWDDSPLEHEVIGDANQENDSKDKTREVEILRRNINIMDEPERKKMMALLSLTFDCFDWGDGDNND